MKVLVINTGSSSLKYQLMDMDNEILLSKGLCERIGFYDSVHKYYGKNGYYSKTVKNIKSHLEAIEDMLRYLVNEDYGVIDDISEIEAIGHRVVHGGEKFSKSVVIDSNVLQAIRDCIDLAPLHNPANIIGIEACMHEIPDTPMVAVFDTAFHQTIPIYAYIYAIPYELYENFGVRKYGFHGTSHRYVSKRVAKLIGKPVEEINLVSCHLGNGASICAVKKGKSIETSMGFTPLSGLAMGTRSGSIDPALISYIMECKNMSAEETTNYLNKQSGVLGLSGISSDFRDLLKASKEGNERAGLAIEVFAYRVKKYISEYIGVMNGVDAVVFTAGIGENNALVRRLITKDMSYLGLKLNQEKNNQATGVEMKVSADDSAVEIFVVPTNEELEIARECKKILQ